MSVLYKSLPRLRLTTGLLALWLECQTLDQEYTLLHMRESAGQFTDIMYRPYTYRILNISWLNLSCRTFRAGSRAEPRMIQSKKLFSWFYDRHPISRPSLTDRFQASPRRILLLPHPLPPLPSVGLTGETQEDWREITCWLERGDWVGKEPNHVTARKSGPL